MVSVPQRGPQNGRRPGAPARAAFTLIELLMAISIIAILVALLTPAVMSVMSSAKDKQVASEIEGLANACADFKATYGEYPPSRITLYEDAAGWNNTDQETQRSKRILRSLFGAEFSFNINRDINGNSTAGETITLEGDQCLVFFLGGMPDTSGGQIVMTGFSHNKANPFARGGANRRTFFKDWDVSRLFVRSTAGNDMPSYRDKLNATNPYLFLSTTPSGVYDVSHVATVPEAPQQPLQNVYMQGSSSEPWKPKGIQIISPGRDGEYGTGGAWTEESSAGLSLQDRDNITNFSGGTLER